jgi:outer membrane protein OmpA-like peptidoglycan-associated protein
VRQPKNVARVFATLVAAATLASGCNGKGLFGAALASDHQAHRKTLVVGARPSSALVVVEGPSGRPSAVAVTDLLAATVRPHETVTVLTPGGKVLLASTTPGALSELGPTPPKPLAKDATTFLVGQHNSEVANYQKHLESDRLRLQARLHAEMQAWVANVAHRLANQAPGGSASAVGVGPALDKAESIFASLQEAGVDTGHREVVAVLAPAGGRPPAITPQLLGATVVVAAFSGGLNDQAFWQQDLLQAGAARAVVLVDGLGSQLGPTVQAGLDGAMVVSLSLSVNFGLGQTSLSQLAKANLAKAIAYLKEHPGATAWIYGYTDALGTVATNEILSQERAAEVKAYLTRDGIAASRLRAVGFGEADPVAPETPHGQPLDRRVVLVVDPG